MTVSISPVFNGQQFFDNLGNPLSGGKLFQYEGGSTSVQQATYTTSVGDVENSNPIVLDSSGRLPTELWLTNGSTYNLVLTQPDGTTVLTYVDGVIGVQASTSGGGGSTVNLWVVATDAPTYVGPTQFLLPGNVTANFHVGNRVQIEYGVGVFTYGTVSAVSFSSPNTQITLVNDSTVMNSGMTAAYWSLITVVGPTGDAGALTYKVPSTYTTPGTIGYELNALETDNTNTNARIDSTYKIWQTSGSGSATPYTITTTPNITSLTIGMIFVVQFESPAIGLPTLNVNGLGAIPLRQYDSSQALIAPIIGTGMVSQVGYDGSNWILLDALPPTPFTPGVVPHGQTTFTSNGTFTVPSNVSTLNVLCIGGGGGGGAGSVVYSGGESGTYTTYPGGPGGWGGSAFKTVTVTPGGSYAVSIGGGGAAGTLYVSGGNGGSTVFGSSLVVATGGIGAAPSAGTAGANGYDASGAYGIYNAGFTVVGAPKGVAGAGDPLGLGFPGAGTAGACIITW